MRKTINQGRSNARDALSYLRYRGRYAYRVIYVACPPKTASTWLNHLLVELLPGFRYHYPSHHPSAQTGYDVTQPVIDELRGKLAVVRSFTTPTPENRAAMEREFGRYVVLIRDVRDIVVSLFHHARAHPRSAFVDQGIERQLPWTPLPKDALDLDDERCLDIVIENMLPGLASLSLDWYEYQQEQDHVLLLRYEDVTQNTADELSRILAHYDLDIPRLSIEAVVAKLAPTTGEFKFRKGIAGNWKNELTVRQQQRCQEIAGDFLEQSGYAETSG